MAGLCAPLSTLRQYPRGHLRMTRGRCGSLLLHRDGLPPSTPCRSPGALRSTPESGLSSDIMPSPKSVTSGPMRCSKLRLLVDQLVCAGEARRGKIEAEHSSGL